MLAQPPELLTRKLGPQHAVGYESRRGERAALTGAMQLALMPVLARSAERPLTIRRSPSFALPYLKQRTYRVSCEKLVTTARSRLGQY